MERHGTTCDGEDLGQFMAAEHHGVGEYNQGNIVSLYRGLTCLILQDSFQRQLAGNGRFMASFWAEGPPARADGCRVLLDVPVLGLLVPRQPQWELHGSC